MPIGTELLTHRFSLKIFYGSVSLGFFVKEPGNEYKKNAPNTGSWC